MAVPFFPTVLPQKPQKENYKVEIELPILTNSMDAGTKSRPKGIFLPDLYTCKYVLTSAQWEILENFVRNTLVNGIKAFNFPHPETGEYVRARLVPDSKLSKTAWKKTLSFATTLELEVYSYANITE